MNANITEDTLYIMQAFKMLSVLKTLCQFHKEKYNVITLLCCGNAYTDFDQTQSSHNNSKYTS